MLQANDALDLATLGARYAAGSLRPAHTVAGILERLARRGEHRVWIHRLPARELEARAAELERRGPQGLPLYGIPFAIKDNIDAAAHPTTAACPDFSYVANENAFVVERLLAAGAAGARMVGGGFGGAVLALLPPGAQSPAGAREVAPAAAARVLAP